MADEYMTDDEQLEHVKRWTSENGPWLIGGVVLGAAALFGYRYYHSYVNERALKAAAQFSEMTLAVQSNDRGKSRQIAGGLIKDYASSPYADQARLTIARLYVDDGQLASAIPPLTQVMDGSKDNELRQIARLRVARIMIDQGKPDEAIKTLADEAAPGAFTARYHEVRGDALLAKKDIAAAVGEYKAAIAARDAGVDVALLELKIADLGIPAATVAKAKP